jgi:N-acetyl-gamma-glutamyl-phosphate reductase
MYEEFYAPHPFVRITRQVPQILAVTRTNYCDIGIAIEGRTNQLIVMSIIDNLVKGAAGQAVQNMNLMFGFPEATGLK